jgi:regulator of cell morphogenesis and NO signaling
LTWIIAQRALRVPRAFGRTPATAPGPLAQWKERDMMQVETLEPLRNRNVGEIAANLAGATEVFRRFGIDFCCHGDIPLDHAAEARGVDIETIHDALSALDETKPASTLPDGTSELIDHIIARYHEVHRRQLPELIMLSRKVEQVHAGKPGVPAGLADLLQKALGELAVHMQKEELMLFPAMRRHGSGPFDSPIGQLRHDHSDQGALLERIAELTSDFTVPEGGCGTWRALYTGAVQFRDDLIDHIHIENNILFPRFESGAAAG